MLIKCCQHFQMGCYVSKCTIILTGARERSVFGRSLFGTEAIHAISGLIGA